MVADHMRDVTDLFTDLVDGTGVMKWKEGSFRFDRKGSNRGIDFQVQEKWMVSADGKTITIDRHFTSDRGNTDQKIVIAK